MIGGTGFMVTQALLDRLGGWRTETISEDLEITAQAVLAGERVAYVPKAATYDEQPLTWEQSFTQRRRWTSGTLQVAQRYLAALGDAQARRPRLALFDFEATLLMPAYQLAALAGLLCTALTAALGGRTPLQALILAAAGVCGNIAWAALTATVAAGVVLTLEGKWDRRLWKGLMAYWLFLLTWLPITAFSFWKKTTVWEEIRHTRTMAPQLPGR